MGALFFILDHIHHIAEVHHVGGDPLLERSKDGVPPVSLNPEMPQVPEVAATPTAVIEDTDARPYHAIRQSNRHRA